MKIKNYQKLFFWLSLNQFQPLWAKICENWVNFYWKSSVLVWIPRKIPTMVYISKKKKKIFKYTFLEYPKQYPRKAFLPSRTYFRLKTPPWTMINHLKLCWHITLTQYQRVQIESNLENWNSKVCLFCDWLNIIRKLFH